MGLYLGIVVIQFRMEGGEALNVKIIWGCPECILCLSQALPKNTFFKTKPEKRFANCSICSPRMRENQNWLDTLLLMLPYGCHNKALPTGQLKEQRCVGSHSRRPEVWAPNVCRLVSSEVHCWACRWLSFPCVFTGSSFCVCLCPCLFL